MNWVAASKLVIGGSGSIPVERLYSRISYALAGYSHIARIIAPAPASVASVISKTCTITMDIEGGY